MDVTSTAWIHSLIDANTACRMSAWPLQMSEVPWRATYHFVPEATGTARSGKCAVDRFTDEHSPSRFSRRPAQVVTRANTLRHGLHGRYRH